MQGETSDRILQTAKTLISDLGYSAFSYADIAEAVRFGRPVSIITFRRKRAWWSRSLELIERICYRGHSS